MSIVGQREILTQRRVVEFFRNALGYAYLGVCRNKKSATKNQQLTDQGWLVSC